MKSLSRDAGDVESGSNDVGIKGGCNGASSRVEEGS